MSIPVPAQNSCLREYVRNNNGVFILPVLESSFPNCFHQLFGLLEKLENSDNIIMYSLMMLPIKEKLNYFLEKCLKKKITLYFVLENIKSNPPHCGIISEIETYNLKKLENNYFSNENINDG